MRSSVATTLSASMVRSTTIAGHSRVYSSTMFNSFNGRGDRRSGRTGSRAPTARSARSDTSHRPRCRSRAAASCACRYGTRRPSSRHSRWTRLLLHVPALSPQPHRARVANPTAGARVENARSHARSSCSSSSAAGASSRCVERCWPTTLHARRSRDPEPFAQHAHRARGAGSGSEVSLRDLLEHRLVELRLREQLLQPACSRPRAP